MYSIQVRKENPFNQTLRVTFTGLVKYAHMIYGIEHKGIEYGILSFNSLDFDRRRQHDSCSALAPNRLHESRRLCITLQLQERGREPVTLFVSDGLVS